MSLKCYKIDYTYKEHWCTRYDKERASKIVKKLLRHFKLQDIKYYFTTNTVGYAYCSNRYIELPKKNISLATICHEVGHLLAHKNGYHGHTKKAYKYIKRVYKWADRYITI